MWHQSKGVSTFSLPATVVFYFREDFRTGAVFSASCTFVHAKLLQSCLTLCDPMDYSPLGSSLHVILHAKILEWLAIPFSRGSSPPGDQTHVPGVSCTGRQVLCHWRHQGTPLLLVTASYWNSFCLLIWTCYITGFVFSLRALLRCEHVLSLISCDCLELGSAWGCR